ncbi:hypothetical protein GGP93_001165 [Salinibacter ruber]|nr:hypothetical protein [Salinibacter ruber]
MVRPKVKISGRSVYLHRLFVHSVNIWKEVGIDILKNISRDTVDKGKDLIISSEGFYGGFSVPRPWYKRRTKKLTDRVNGLWSTSGSPYSSAFAKHLKAVQTASKSIGFEGFKMLGNIRRQDQKIASGYAEMSSSIKGASQDHFEEWVRFILESPIGYYGLGGSKLDYYRWWLSSVKKIGKENVLILPVELLDSDKDKFLNEWISFMNIGKQNVPEKVSEDRKRVNPGTRNVWNLRPPARGLDSIPYRLMQKLGISSNIAKALGITSREKSIEVSKSIQNKIMYKYKESNKKIDKQLESVDLSKYGYF